MRFGRFGLLIFLLMGLSVWTQQPASSQQATAPPPAPQDPQAVSVLNQALAVAGGTSAIRAIQDYTGSGNITYPSEQNAQGTVTVLGLNGTEFRMDANLPAGTRSWGVADGVITSKNELGAIWSMAPKGPIPSSDAFPFQTPLFPGSIAFPFRQLATVVGNPRYSLSYKGVFEVDGHSVHDIQFQRGFSADIPSGGFETAGGTRDIFIDTTNFQVVKVSDTLPKGVPQEIHYSDYRPVGVTLMPFSITDEIQGQQAWIIQLNQISLNAGLQPTSFVIQ
jgi:hypothetical protein